MSITSYGEYRVLNVGTMEIWDGAELSLIRETLRRLIEEQKCPLVGVDMRYVKHVPSGFFGMLCEWHDKGVCIRLLGPLSHVKQMLWFTRFFHFIGDEFHEFRPCPLGEFEEPAVDCVPAQESVIAVDVPHHDERCTNLERSHSGSCEA